MVEHSNHDECVDQYVDMLTNMLTFKSQTILKEFPAQDGMAGITEGKARWQITQAKRCQPERADD